jgi:hypothetical protein
VLTCPAENILPDATALGGGDHRLPRFRPPSGVPKLSQPRRPARMPTEPRAGFSPLAAVGDLPVPVICWQRDWS